MSNPLAIRTGGSSHSPRRAPDSNGLLQGLLVFNVGLSLLCAGLLVLNEYRTQRMYNELERVQRRLERATSGSRDSSRSEREVTKALREMNEAMKNLP